MDSPQDKKAKTVEENDIISTLPDEVLGHILSLLPTKYAARTSILSTFWKRIFSSSPVVDFDDSLDPDITSEARNLLFRRFVTFVLIRRNFSPFDKFQLHCTKFDYDIKLVIKWITLAILSQAREIDVNARVIGSASLEEPLFFMKTLTTLVLRGKFTIDVPYAYLPKLKIMVLEEVEFLNDDSAQRLFSCCPVLEELRTLGCAMGNIRVLIISNPSLKKLVFCDNDGMYGLLLNTANLEEMCYSASHVVWGRTRESFMSLVRAAIFTEEEDKVFVNGLIYRICNVKFLTLSGGSMEALFGSDQLLPNFCNLTHLDLLPDCNVTWKYLPSLLACSPCLEFLSFDHSLQVCDEYSLEVAQYFPDPVPVCLLERLKEVKVSSFHGEEDELRLVEYFLKNAKVLEKIILSPSSPWCSEYKVRLSMKGQFLITKRLLKLQRCSKGCRIVFI